MNPERGESWVGRTSALRDLRMERFPDVYEQWTSRQIGRAHAAGLLGVSEKTFRRYVARYRELGLKGLEDRRATSSRSASDEEIAALEALYAEHYPGWPVRKFHRAYTDLHGGARSYNWVKGRLQEAGLVTPRRSTRERNGRQPAEGVLLHQASCTFEWSSRRIWELVALVDDASYRVHSGLFVESDAIRCRLRTVQETIAANGLFEAIHVDRALRSHHDRRETGRFRCAMRSVGIRVVPSCPSEAQRMYKRAFRVLRAVLPLQLAAAGIQSLRRANEFLPSYWVKFNRFFAIEPKQSTPAFLSLGSGLQASATEILCPHESRDVDALNDAGQRGMEKTISDEGQPSLSAEVT